MVQGVLQAEVLGLQMTKGVTHFSLSEEIKEAYRDLDVITSRTEYRDKEKYIIELESELIKLEETSKENCQN